MVALDRATGERVWTHSYGESYDPGFDDREGPHATPLLVDERLVTLGIDGSLRGLDATTGRLAWRHELRADFGAPRPQAGFAASPLAWGRSVIVNVGGRENAAVVAFDLVSGEVVWRAHSHRGSHASPRIVRPHRRPHLVLNLIDMLRGLDPDTGELL